MPLRRKVTSAGMALGLVLLLAGCGGPQNPWKVGNYAFFNGWWDGFTALLLAIGKIFGGDYGLRTHHAGLYYNVGWVFGVICSFLALFVLADTFAEVATGLLLGAAVVLMLLLMIYSYNH